MCFISQFIVKLACESCMLQFPGLTFPFRVDVTTSAIAMIVLGVLILMIGCFGCFGAVTGKHGLLNVYLIGLLVIIIIEVAFIIYGI